MGWIREGAAEVLVPLLHAVVTAAVLFALALYGAGWRP